MMSLPLRAGPALSTRRASLGRILRASGTNDGRDVGGEAGPRRRRRHRALPGRTTWAWGLLEPLLGRRRFRRSLQADHATRADVADGRIERDLHGCIQARGCATCRTFLHDFVDLAGTRRSPDRLEPARRLQGCRGRVIVRRGCRGGAWTSPDRPRDRRRAHTPAQGCARLACSSTLGALGKHAGGLRMDACCRRRTCSSFS